MQRHLLLVDGELQYRMMAVVALKRAGYQVSDVRDGEEALSEALKAHQNGSGFDLILTELELSDISGIELIDKLRRYNIIAPVCVVTGSEDINLIGRLLNKKIAGFVYKLAGFQTLLKHVGEIVKRTH